MKAIDQVVGGTKDSFNKAYNKVKSINYTKGVVKSASTLVASLILYTSAGSGLSAAQENYHSDLNSGIKPEYSIKDYKQIGNKISKTISMQQAQGNEPKDPEEDDENLVKNPTPNSNYFSTPDSNYSYVEKKKEDNQSKEVKPEKKLNQESINKLKSKTNSANLAQSITLENPMQINYIPQKIPIVNKRGKIKDYTTNADSAFNAGLFYSLEKNVFFNKRVSKGISKRDIRAHKKQARKNKKGKGDAILEVGDLLLNPYVPSDCVPPSYAGYEEDHGHHYASSDATDENEFYGPDDYNAAVGGNLSDRTDLNADGNLNNDLTTQHDYFVGNITHIAGGDWRHSTDAEKIDFFNSYAINIDMTNLIPPGPNWDCDQYAFQFFLGNRGVFEVWNSGVNANLYDTTNNGRSNMPVCRVTGKSIIGEAHRYDAVLVGPSSLDFWDWLFHEPQDDSNPSPGDPSMHPDYPVKVDVFGKFNDPGVGLVYGFRNLVWWNLNGGVPTLSFQHPGLVTTKPSELGDTLISGTNPPDIQINPEESTLPSNTGTPGADSWATEHYSDTDNRTGTTSDSTYWNYNITRPWWAISNQSPRIFRTYGSTDTTNFPNDPAQEIMVRDTTSPVITENTSQTSILNNSQIFETQHQVS